MQMDAVPEALSERLGAEATDALLQLFDRAHQAWRADVMAACTDRFERRLVEEAAGLRVQIAQTDASLRQEIAGMGAALRQEMAELGGTLRQEMGATEGRLRQEMGKLEAGLRQDMWKIDAGLRQDMWKIDAGLRQDMAKTSFELLKWCFVFWIGQVVTLTAIMGVMLRLFRT